MKAKVSSGTGLSSVSLLKVMVLWVSVAAFSPGSVTLACELTRVTRRRDLSTQTVWLIGSTFGKAALPTSGVLPAEGAAGIISIT